MSGPSVTVIGSGVARTPDKTDSYITMVLSMNGRVRPADLHMVAEEARTQTLLAYFEAHRAETELHLAGEELVAGPEPAFVPVAAAPVPEADAAAAHAPAQPTDLTESGESAIDLLLGDYDGVASGADEQFATVDALGDAGASPPAGASAVPSAGPAGAGRPGTRSPASGEPEPPGSRLWLLWWIPTLLVPTLGGLAAWFFVRRKHQTPARVMLGVGLAIGMFASILFLRYAEQIATVTLRATSPTVIELPSTPPASSGTTAPSGGEGASGTPSARE